MVPILPRAGSVADIEAGSVVGAFFVRGLAGQELTTAVVQSKDDLVVDLQGISPSEASVTAETLLNLGAVAVVVDQVPENDTVVIPASRIIVGVKSTDAAVHYVSSGFGVLITEADASKIDIDVIVKTATSWATSEKVALPLILTDQPIDVTSKIPSEVTQVVDASELVPTLCKRLKSDRPDGLWTTVVTNERLQALGVCFSSAESVSEAVRTRTGVYQSRARGLWYKGASSGATQKLVKIGVDCDGDALQFVVAQLPPGFCHNNTSTCFGDIGGLTKLGDTVASRLEAAPQGSYTKRLVTEPGLLEAKIREEADELCDATDKDHVAFEAADLLYFMSVKLAKHGLSLADVEANLDKKSRKILRRPGNAKPGYTKESQQNVGTVPETKPQPRSESKLVQPASSKPIHMHVVDVDSPDMEMSLERPAQSSNAFELARPIVDDVRKRGDKALLEYTARFEKAELASPVMTAPFPPEAMKLPPALKEAIDLACANVAKFHAAQLSDPLSVTTSPGVVCSRFARAIDRVGLYIPGGSAILPSTAVMLGVPAQVAGCKHIAFATPPRPDGTPSPEIVYVAHKVGASQILLAGGAQAVAALAYGTESVPKVDKILGPGNQFVTAAKMLVSTDVSARVAIDMPAGPSEVLVVADTEANKAFVAADLLSQAEHGPDSQVILVAVAWTDADVAALQTELDRQAQKLPRVDIVRRAIDHSTIVVVKSRQQALELSNRYAPEHLILQVSDAASLLPLVQNAGSVFVGAWSPESCGDYTSGTNHTLPTYGYARQYSGVNTGTYLKHITAQELTYEGISGIGPATIDLARREGLDAHAEAVVVRLNSMK